MIPPVDTADIYRLDGLAPNTPRVGSTSKANGSARRKFETPSMSRVKAEPASSPPEFKAPYKPGESGQVAQYDWENIPRNQG
jgi:DNA polymerase alpha subunit B